MALEKHEIGGPLNGAPIIEAKGLGVARGGRWLVGSVDPAVSGRVHKVTFI